MKDCEKCGHSLAVHRINLVGDAVCAHEGCIDGPCGAQAVSESK